MSIPFQIGFDAITSYKRLAYTPWHAIAEFVDNSTQSYFNNREQLDELAIPGQLALRWRACATRGCGAQRGERLWCAQMRLMALP